MTRTANELITSDGTAILRFRNPDTVDETHHIVVRDGHKIVDQLNELEYIEGDIYANVWYSDRIARISPQDRHVIAWIDLTGLLPANRRINNESVLNGIAYDAKNDRLFVTGKPVADRVRNQTDRSKFREIGSEDCRWSFWGICPGLSSLVRRSFRKPAHRDPSSR